MMYACKISTLKYLSNLPTSFADLCWVVLDAHVTLHTPCDEIVEFYRNWQKGSRAVRVSMKSVYRCFNLLSERCNFPAFVKCCSLFLLINFVSVHTHFLDDSSKLLLFLFILFLHLFLFSL
ncbi:hypothetical protein Dimus_036062 [Dionaea muscipula]